MSTKFLINFFSGGGGGGGGGESQTEDNERT